MMDTGYAKDTPVREFKKQIIEEAKVLGIDCVLELDKMRLWEKNGVFLGTLYLDHDWIGEAWIGGTTRRIDDTNREIHVYVEPLKGPEKKMLRYKQVQVYVIRWRPSQCSVDSIEEIILDDGYDHEHVIEKLSELSGVPAEYIYYSEHKKFPVEISCLDIENKFEWYSISSYRFSFELYDDGYVLYYKDNRETMKELTYEERYEIRRAEKARLNRIKEIKALYSID
ncbi:PREDICTED: ubiquitin carboxyl-terminal hydrolase 47-like [Amphimedon queenslandica]|nr:PREDICTED: ubiquitin carboxyl-terminal hydrolase 47-like [Amphimedon queenslandica]|eukprot:XP_019860560.1 PREDICTED: ubiquitin carboxyl-terminal hydrolase 47-like [Amphimedon queenslandica]